MPNELIPFTDDPDLLIYPIVDYERGLPVVECQRSGGSGTWYFNCPFCGDIHSHFVGQVQHTSIYKAYRNPLHKVISQETERMNLSKSEAMEISPRPQQRVLGNCQEQRSPFYSKEYYIREQGDEVNGKWDKYLELLDSHRGRRTVYKKQNSVMLAFGAYCLDFSDPNAATTNLELGRAWLLFCDQQNITADFHIRAPLTLDLQTGTIVTQESNSAFSRKFHATFCHLHRKRLRDGTTRQWAFVGVQVDWLKLGRI
jgi:hypothetical protein